LARLITHPFARQMKIKVNLPYKFIKEENKIIAICTSLSTTSQGETEEEALLMGGFIWR
jgi:hypothetical protein